MTCIPPLGLTLAYVAHAFCCCANKISRLEGGEIRDLRFLHHYRAWRTTTPIETPLDKNRSIAQT
jgi:hypothetical protein